MIIFFACFVAVFLTVFNQDKSGSKFGIKVSDSEWEKRLNINIESYDNFTFSNETKNTYEQEQAKKYGKWNYEKTIESVDAVSENICSVSAHIYYLPQSNSSVVSFANTVSFKYTIKYKDKYYIWCDGKASKQQSVTVTEITKEDYLNQIKSISKACSQFNAHSDPAIKTNFNYNEATSSYETDSIDELNTSIRFSKNNGVKLTTELNSTEANEISVFDIGKTKVSIPTEVYNDVDYYIEQNKLNNC